MQRNLLATLGVIAVVLVGIGCTPEAKQRPAVTEEDPVLLNDLFLMAAALKVGTKPCADYANNMKGILQFTNGDPADSAKVEIKCGDLSLAECTATVPAGAMRARCETDKVSVSTLSGDLSCSITVLAGNPTEDDYYGACVDP